MIIEKRVEKLEQTMNEIVAKLDVILKKEDVNKSIIQNKIFQKEESPREFLLRFNPKNDTEKTLVAIHFLENKGINTITSNSIKDTFKRMRENIPKNISDKIQMLDKQALLVKVGEEGKTNRWAVSNKGEDYLKEMEENAE